METTIRELFSNQDRQFQIPQYQRAYSWEKEQIDQFLEDLSEASTEYYLGHFLFQEDVVAGREGKLSLIIDGQQRLTTCVIFFSALHGELSRRKAAGELLETNLDVLGHIYLRDLIKGTQKLTTVRDDNNFFAREIIDRKPGTGGIAATRSQECIRDAHDRIAAALSAAKIADIERWRDLIEQARCTEFPVKDPVGAARIFAFQNDRGKPLSDLEVLKSFFMLQVYLHSGSAEIRQEYLKYLEADVSTIYHQIVRVDLGENEVLRYCWQACSASKGFETRKTVEEIKTYVLQGGSGEVCARIREFMEALSKAFKLVEIIEEHTDPNVINLRYLDRMALAYPLLMRAYHHGARPEQLVAMARLLENITFRALLRGGRAGIESRLNHYLRMPANSDYVETVATGVVSEIRAAGSWWYWSDAVMDDLLNADYFYQNRVDNYLLWRYELDLCARSNYTPPLKVGYADLISNECIEHIAPRTESPGEAIANGYGIYHDAKNAGEGIESGMWLNCLGNLLLIHRSHNSAIKNYSFSTKLASYGKANLLNQQKEIGRFVTDPANPVWDKAAIERRHNELVAVAKRLWSLDNL